MNEWQLLKLKRSAGVAFGGMAPSGPLYFLHKATPPTMPPVLGHPPLAMSQVPFVHE